MSAFRGIPIVEMPDLTATIMLFIDSTKFLAVSHRPFEVQAVGRTDDSAQWDLSESIVQVCTNPHVQGKVTGL